MIDYEHDRFGSARWADGVDIRKAGLLGESGTFIGYYDKRLMRLRTDAPAIIVGGAGSGKCRDLLAEMILRSPDENFWVFDPKGELVSIAYNAFARKKANLWIWNPFVLHGLPQNRCNPFDPLTRDNPRLIIDAQTLIAAMIPYGMDTNYFVDMARAWCVGIAVSHAEQFGKVSPPDLYRVVKSMTSDAMAWDAQLTAMENSAHADVRAVGGEIWQKQQTGPREFQSIYGSINQALTFLSDPNVRFSMEESDFSLKQLCVRGERPESAFFLMPAEYTKSLAGATRLLFAATTLYKFRHAGGKTLTMILDEAGQVGQLEALREAVTYGRGAGIRAIPVFQDIGQIQRNFGEGAVQTFIGSAQWRCFMGVRDYQTAHLISLMLGFQTMEFDDDMAQRSAERAAMEAVQRFSQGGDPFAAAFDYNIAAQAAQHRTKMQRHLMSADEILNMPADRMISFISGLNLPPIYAQKFPYYSHKDLAGQWLPNPYHPPLDHVMLPSFWGPKRANIIKADVPPEFAQYPQYESGTMRYVEGHYPF